MVDIGSGGGLDAMIAAKAVGDEGAVVGVDMTPAMVDRARRNARAAGLRNVDFRHGLAERIPVGDRWADVVISNGVLNLVPAKMAGMVAHHTLEHEEWEVFSKIKLLEGGSIHK